MIFSNIHTQAAILFLSLSLNPIVQLLGLPIASAAALNNSTQSQSSLQAQPNIKLINMYFSDVSGNPVSQYSQFYGEENCPSSICKPSVNTPVGKSKGSLNSSPNSGKVLGVLIQKQAKNTRTMGSGCPVGTVSAVISPDSKALSILFDNFTVDSQRGNEVVNNCSIVLDLSFPKGLTVAIEKVDFRGFAFSASPANFLALWSEFNTIQNNKVDSIGSVFISYQGVIDSTFTVSKEVSLSALACNQESKSVQILLNNGIIAKSVDGMAAAVVTVDSMDKNMTTTYNLKWYNCNDSQRDVLFGKTN